MAILTIVGARPQFVKAAPLSRALAEAGIREILLHTGQHYDRNMSGVFFEELELRPPEIDLGVGSGSHAAQTAAMLIGIERAIVERKPDWVLVYGDTNSTVAGALAAAKCCVPLAHVEAGLRSFNRRMPEEINRIVTDRLADVLFCPTATSCQHLRNEGTPEERIRLVGDVMYDATLMFREMALLKSRILRDLGLTPGEYILATVHRAENTDNPARLRGLVEGLGRAARRWPVVAPLHPRTRKALSLLDLALPAGVRLIDPVGFLDMVRLEMAARVIATDSGGVQKEAFFHGVPCVTMRDETEWVELTQAGANQLCPPEDSERLGTLLTSVAAPLPEQPSIFGDGKAAQRIADALAGGDKPAQG